MKRFIFILSFILISNFLYSKPYGLRKSDKDWDFNFTIEANYMAVDHNAYFQVVAIPELTFGKENIGVGFYFPFSFNRYYQIRQIEYNSTEALVSKLYYFEWGVQDKSPFYMKIAAIDDFTLGQGLLAHRYNNTLSQPEIRKLGLIAQVDYHGFKLKGIIGDLFTQSVTGGRLSYNFFKNRTGKKGFLTSLELGVSFISDFNPKRRNVVYVTNNYDHKITLNTDSSSAVHGYGADISMTLLDNSAFIIGIHAEFAKLSISGEGIAYGIQGAIAPEFMDLKYKFQLRHFMNSFEPSYFNSVYDIYRSYKVDASPSTRGDLGWYAELTGTFYKKRMGLTLAYEEVIKGSNQPHLYLKYFMYAIPESLYLTLQYDQYALGDQNLTELENFNTYFFFEALIQFNRYIEFGLSFRKGFILEENPNEALKNLESYTIHTKLMF